MKRAASHFERICRQRLQFLEEDFGFTISKVERESSGIFITYQNAVCAVRVSFEPREGGVFVLLSRLVNGRVPEYPIFIHHNSVLHSFYLNDLVALRAPAFRFECRVQDLASETQIDGVLQQVASALRTYGADVLRGDFNVFEQLDGIVKRRMESLRRTEAK